MHKTVLLTGATGFIGRVVAEHVLNAGCSLITTASKPKAEAEKAFPLLKETEYLAKDLNEKEENYFAYFKKPDCVIHLSWQGLPNYNELFHIDKSLFSSYYFLHNMVQNGLADITITGTCFEYGLQNGCLNEEMITAPVTIYGLAKDTLRKFMEALQLKYQFSMKWLRIFYPYGHGQSEKSLYTQLENAILEKRKQFDMSFGEQLRDYLSVNCMAEYIVKLALSNTEQGIVNCCSGKPVSVRSFVENFFKEREYPIKLNLGAFPYNNYEPMAFWGDTKKLGKNINIFNAHPPPPPTIGLIGII